MTSVARRSAIFLDRDGVVNRNVFYADTQAFESPRSPSELCLVNGVGPALRALQERGHLLVLVSNQPNGVKGKCSRETLDRIHDRLVELLAAEHVTLDKVFYCYHHPEHTGPCACRKPGAYFLEQAIAEFGLESGACWMIGDRESDVSCGRAVGVRTVWIDTGENAPGSTPVEADVSAGSLAEAVEALLAFS